MRFWWRKFYYHGDINLHQYCKLFRPTFLSSCHLCGSVSMEPSADRVRAELDRFSALPTDVAHRILSPFPLADVARVGTLSKGCRAFHLSNPPFSISLIFHPSSDAHFISAWSCWIPWTSSSSIAGITRFKPFQLIGFVKIKEENTNQQGPTLLRNLEFWVWFEKQWVLMSNLLMFSLNLWN